MIQRETPTVELSEGRKIATIGVGGRFAFCTREQTRKVYQALGAVIPLMVDSDGQHDEQPAPAFQHVPALLGMQFAEGL